MISGVQAVLLVLIVNLFAYVAVTLVAWWNRHKPGVWYFVFGAVFMILFSLSDIAVLTTRSVALIERIQVLTTGLAPAATATWVLFVLGYLGYLADVSRWQQAAVMGGLVGLPLLLAAIPGIYVEPSVAPLWGTPSSSPRFDAVGSVVLLSTLAALLMGSLLLFRAALAQRVVKVRTAAVLAVPALVFLLAATVGIVGIVPRTLPLPRVVGPFAAAAYLYFFAVAEGFSVLPATGNIGVDQAFDQLDAGVVVVEDDTIIRCNPTATEYLGLERPNVATGESAAAVLDEFAGRPIDDPVVTVKQNDRVYEITRSQIHSSGVVLLIQDVTTRRERLELQRQNEQLERLAHIVSHDFQTPLSTANKLTTLLRLDEGVSGTEAAQTIDDLEAVHDRLTTFADQLPTLARESASIGDPTDCELADVAASAWDVVETGPLKLDIVSSRQLIGDATRLEQAFQNLFENVVIHGNVPTEWPGNRPDSSTASATPPTDVSNAIQRETSASTVTVGRTESGFYVADDGPGFVATQDTEIFDYGMSTGSGSGLGLAIVRTIFEAHGWEISATESASGGARFDVHIETGPPEIETESAHVSG